MKKETFHLLLNFLIILRIDLYPLYRRYKKAKSLVKNAPHRLHGRFLTRLFPFLCRVIKRIRRIFATLFANSLRKNYSFVNSNCFRFSYASNIPAIYVFTWQSNSASSFLAIRVSTISLCSSDSSSSSTALSASFSSLNRF